MFVELHIFLRVTYTRTGIQEVVAKAKELHNASVTCPIVGLPAVPGQGVWELQNVRFRCWRSEYSFSILGLV